MCITNLEKESGWQNGQRGLADFLGILVKKWNVTFRFFLRQMCPL